MSKQVTFVGALNRKTSITEGEKYLKEKMLSSPVFSGWTVYEQPRINSMQPGFILTHSQKGILIIEVKDWSLEAPEYLKNGQVRGANGNYFTDNPVNQVMTYKELILKYELDTFLEAVEHYDDTAFKMMTPIVYFHQATRKNAVNFTRNIEPEDCLVWSRSDLDELSSPDAKRDDDRFPKELFIERSTFTRGPEKLMQRLVSNLNKVVSPSEDTKSKKRPLTLTSEQNKLISIQKGSIRRWGGVAGSGKTVVIATKAAEAIRQGERVLVLTYNITLRHYIRDLCAQQYIGDNHHLLKSHLTIAHFHGFLKILMVELGLQAPSGSVETHPEWSISMILNKINEQYPEYLRYDSIFIDEGQDFSGDWIRFIKNIYTEQGELLVMYDEAQNTYGDQGVWITDPDEVSGIGFRGEVGHLSITHRLPNGIVYQIDRLSDLFGIEKRLHATNEQIDLFTDIKWMNVKASADRVDLVKERIDSILSRKISNIEDITVITMNEKSGIEVVKGFEALGWDVSHMYDTKQSTLKPRDEKWRFQPTKDKLKISSYHSYKGWESSHVILLLEGVGNEEDQWKNMLDALYISLTRVSAFSNSRSFTCINKEAEFNHLKKYFE